MITMLMIMLTWLLVHMIFVGIGHLIMQNFARENIGGLEYFLNFWIGWAVALIILQFWNLLFPVNDFIRIVLTIIGLVGYGLCLKDYKSVLKNNKLSLFFLFLVGLWLSNRALLTTTNYDDGLYRLQVIRWFTEYSIVPGLGHLHDRLAFSNGFFLYPALYNTGFWYGKVFHLSNGILVWMSVCYIAFLVLISDKRYSIIRYLGIFVLLAIMYQFKKVSSVSNDVPIVLLGYLLGLLIWRYIITVNGRVSSKQILPQMLTIILLASIGVMIKFSFIMIGGLSSILAVIIWLWSERANYRKALSGFAISFIIALMVFIPMGIRSVLHTGYILYPMTSFGGFDVPWKIPAEKGQQTMETIAVWARQPIENINDASARAEILSNYDWLPKWLDDNIYNNKVNIFLIALTFFGLITIFICVVWRKYSPPSVSLSTLLFLWIYWVSLVISIGFWFFSAPDPRFLGVTHYLLAFSTIGILLLYLPYPRLRIVTALIVIVPFAYLILRTTTLFIVPYAQGDLYPQPQLESRLFTTNSGLEIYVPRGGDDRCWDEELPCTPYLNEDIQLIIPNNLGSGFMLAHPDVQND